MPGNVANAAPTSVMPRFLCTRFVLRRQFVVEQNRYKDDGVQSRARVATPRLEWDVSPAIEPADLLVLRAYLEGLRWIAPFYFYDGTHTAPKWLHDPTGVVTEGRFTVVARGPWVQSMGMALANVDLQLIQVA